MPKLTKEARERLVALHNVYANRDGSGPARTADDIWTSLAYIDALEAERDALKARVAVLAEECRATRSWTDGRPEGRDEVWWGGDEWGHMMNARAATDSAGALEGGKP